MAHPAAHDLGVEFLPQFGFDPANERQYTGIDAKTGFNPTGQARCGRQFRNFIITQRPTNPPQRRLVDAAFYEGMPDTVFLRGFQTGPVIGEVVEIVDGPFADFTGEVKEIDKDAEEVTVMVKIFGRETPVRLGFEGIDKL